MQHLGRPNQCWLFTSYAARQITALNYHRIRTLPTASGLDQEIYDVVYWCYYFDRTLSSLLGRPPSLPDLEVSPAELTVSNPSSPYNDLLGVILDLAQVQGKLQTISCGNASQSTEQALERCKLLESRMQDILPRLQSVCFFGEFPLIPFFIKLHLFRLETINPRWYSTTGSVLTSATMLYSSRSTELICKTLLTQLRIEHVWFMLADRSEHFISFKINRLRHPGLTILIQHF